MRLQLRFVVFLTLLAACGGQTSTFQQVAPAPRRMVMWLDGNGLDLHTAVRLQRAGVDQVVQRRGGIDLGGGAPVLRLRSAAPIEGPIPFAIALEVTAVRDGLDRPMAEAVWRGLEAELDSGLPAELILDLPQLSGGMDEFISALTEVSGVVVVPLLSFDQLQTPIGRQVAEAARICVVPAYGTDGAELRGVRDQGPLPLVKKFESLAAEGIRVRPAIVIGSRTEPPLSFQTDDIDPLTEGGVTTVSTTSVLDRTFTFNTSMTWNGRQWKAGDELAVRWFDASRLHAALTEIHQMLLPEVAGWDLVPFPADDHGLGLPRATLLRYLSGEGPEPTIDVRVARNGRSLRCRVENLSPFTTAVSRFGNWIEIVVVDGWLTARERGTFERFARGTHRGGTWKEGDVDNVNAVRFYENYLAPHESVSSGIVRLPSSGSRVIVRWSMTLPDGSKLTGELNP